jgi:hypothetical protein
MARAARPFSELMPEAAALDTVRSLCLAHMDAEVKGSAVGRAFLDHGLAATFAARGIALDVATPAFDRATEPVRS